MIICKSSVNICSRVPAENVEVSVLGGKVEKMLRELAVTTAIATRNEMERRWAL